MIMHPRITIIEITQQNTFLVINARTGILKPSLRTITIASVRSAYPSIQRGPFAQPYNLLMDSV